MEESEDLVVETRVVDEIGIVRADGVVDLATMRPMREAVRALILTGVKHVVLDLRGVSYMDSAGLSVILTAKHGVEDQRGQVYVVTQPGAAERSLHLVQLDRLVQLAGSPEEALEALGSAPGP